MAFATAAVTARSIDETGASRSTHGSPSKYVRKILSAVRVANAWVVSVGFGPPSALASAELSATNRRLTQRASPFASSTESSALALIRIVEWLWITKGGLWMR